MNNGFPVRNEFKISGFIVKVYFLVITLNAFSSHTKKNFNNTIKIVENSVIYLFFKPSATHAHSNSIYISIYYIVHFSVIANILNRPDFVL